MWVATFSDPDDNYFQLMSPMYRLDDEAIVRRLCRVPAIYSSTAVSRGCRSMPHFVHRPGLELTTSGCIGQTYSGYGWTWAEGSEPFAESFLIGSAGGRLIIRSIAGPPVLRNRTTSTADSSTMATFMMLV